MALRLRFTLYFSLLFIALLALFSTLVYRQVKWDLLATADRALAAHLEHDSVHVGHSHHQVHGKRAQQVYLRIWENGRLIEDSFPPETGTENQPIFQRLKVLRDGREYELAGYYDLTVTNAYLSTLSKVLLAACILALLVVIPFGLVMTKLLLTPFTELATKTSELNAKCLSFRFRDPGRNDEYGMLVRNFNRLLARLEESFSQVKRFASNASHELRTPLAVIIGQAEMVLRRPRSVEEHREVAEKILYQAKHLRSTTNHLLTLAHIERAGAESVNTEIVVGDTVRDVVDTLSTAYRATGKNVVLQGTKQPLRFRGSEEILRSIVSNLVENALKYSRRMVTVAVEYSPKELRLRVEDDGPGIPPEKRERVFELTPGDTGPASSPVGSHGLGLSIVKSCLDACRGAIRFGESRLGGLSVEVLLPES